MRLRPVINVVISAALCAVFGCGGAGGRGEYSIRSVGELSGFYTVPINLNDSGQVVADGSGGGGGEADIGRAFIWKDGAINETGTLGGFWSHSGDINSSGTVVGYSYTSGGEMWDPAHGFFFQNGVLTDLTPSAVNSRASGINDQGDIVGSIAGADGRHRPTLWRNGQTTDLPSLAGFENSLPLEINNAGTIIAIARDFAPSYKTHSFIIQNGALRDIGTLGGLNTTAARMNNNSEVVGTSETSKSVDPGGTYQNTLIRHAFLWTNGVLRDLGALGGKNSEAYGVNDRGWVVGIAETDPTAIIGSPNAPFLYRNGKMTDINKLIDSSSGWTIYSAVAINNRNQILASGTKGVCVLTPR